MGGTHQMDGKNGWYLYRITIRGNKWCRSILTQTCDNEQRLDTLQEVELLYVASRIS